ncbi:MAG TPA: hypothetical protein VEC01_04265 [Noviherbaspirillum sp.]|uniref:YncE family protein n=1 Tax=Noviherbaspirillum sp. TaxID=1926288 RepID=UPI002D654F6F|nr:hypothetical protein [Noviherbaspirillum sp.]HYD94517.1 hypothetical protein [Noviherbaspirillum sp.]
MSCPTRNNIPLSALVLLSTVLALAACGGGGGGAPAPESLSNAPTNAAPDTPIATESAPKGATVDLKPLNLLPLDSDQARWEYDITDALGRYLYAGVRQVAKPASNAGYSALLSETESTQTDSSRLIARDDGIYVDYASDPELPPQAARQIGQVREFAYAAYAVDEPRVVLRQGVWDQDLDGDGKHEAFRFEFTQVYRGMAPLTVPLATTNAARFTNTYRFSVTRSKAGDTDGFVLREEVHLAPGLGPLKMVRQEESLSGAVVYGPHTWTIARMQNVGAQQPSTTPGTTPTTTPTTTPAQPESPSTPTVQRIELPHNDLVYDAGRNRYYASLPSTVTGNGNAIATIDPATGAVAYSAAIGSEPGRLALSPDGKFLYVALQGAGEVVKLSLPSLAVAARVSLGSDAFYGTYFAESIAVSPANSNVFAVSLYSKAVSPRHRGVALYTGAGFAQKRTQDHTGSNLIVFSEDGSALYGYNNETTEFGLRRIAVAPDGLTEQKVVSASRGFGGAKMTVRGGMVYLKGAVFDAADLTQKGQYLSVAATCEALAPGAKTACLPPYMWTSDKSISIHDTAAMTTLGSLPLPAALAQDLSALVNLVPGPAGQIAITHRGWQSDARPALYLLSDNSLK